MAPPKPKTPVTPQANTLFNYFQRTPVRPPPPNDGDETPKGRPTEDLNYSPTQAGSSKKRKSEPLKVQNTRKKVRVIESDDEEDGDGGKDGDGDENYSPPQSPGGSSSSGSEGEEEDLESLESEEEQVPKGRKKKKRASSRWSMNRTLDSEPALSDEEEQEPRVKVASALKEKLSNFSMSGSGCQSPMATSPASSISSKGIAKSKKGASNAIESEDDENEEILMTGERSGDWPHLKLDFLQPDKIKDVFCHRPGDPKYDPTTLFVPPSFIDDQTPAHQQWWKLKKQNYDAILFFKMGKFYEFFHMDAVTAVEELNIAYMKGDYCHAGFPEAAYSKYANMLIEKGYKIARIEQTENPEMLNERLKKSKGRGAKRENSDKAVRRELCQIATKGIRTASIQDPSGSSPFSPESKYLYAVCEKLVFFGRPIFGVCFVDTTIGEFHLGQFQDDRFFSRLRTVFSHYPPAHILVVKGNLVEQADDFINSFTGLGVRVEWQSMPFRSANWLTSSLRERGYFTDEADSGTLGFVWPSALKQIINPGNNSVTEDYELAFQAFGAVEACLDKCMIAHELLTLKRFSLYKPLDTLKVSRSNGPPLQANMVLDSMSLINLDIVESATPGFSLLSLVDSCRTPFGKRLLREWVCKPLGVPRDIEKRLDSIEELRNFLDLKNAAITSMRSLPDLERLLSKAHALGSAHRANEHPDGRAFMFEEIKYSKNKITDLLGLIRGFKTGIAVIRALEEINPKSDFLRDLLYVFPSAEMEQILEHFDKAFDHKEASKIGKIIPQEGVEEDFDRAEDEIDRIHKVSNDYLQRKSKEFGIQCKWFGSDKKRFQLEVPEKVKVPSDWAMSSHRKGFKRYVNAATKKFLEDLLKAEAMREDILKDITRRIFEKFDSHYETWKRATDYLAKLDAMMSIATYSTSQEDMCRPKVVVSDQPFIKIVQGRHPMMPYDVCIANSCYMGVPHGIGVGSYGTFILLTGPNMGGKSTLMREVALIAVLAHIGCYVPAEACEMSVIDRIFTRIGAADNIGEGESTFFVELSEAGSILRHCTNNSLVLMDELGRGTATYDGTSIAFAVAKKLAENGIRTLFSTHYHSLVESLQNLRNVQLAHMACMVENENELDPTQETITFLYKMNRGPCPKSYGFNAAQLAGLPDEVIRTGHQKAKEFESSNSNVDAFRKTAGVEKQNVMSLDRIMKLLSLQ